MTRGLWWSFGEPREEGGELVTDFYYRIGRHVELRLPWPTKHFPDAGGLSIHAGGSQPPAWRPDITTKTEETGRRLYDLLGSDAQSALIKTFAGQVGNSNSGILYLHFPPPTAKNREICLTLEDLPWELLHDGQEFITWRYDLQIVRAHPREAFPVPPRTVDVSAWKILLVSPFVFSEPELCQRNGLASLPHGREEIKALRSLQRQTHGLVSFEPSYSKDHLPGITSFSELEKCLLQVEGSPFHVIHFVGHGVIYDDEPCLCFETDQHGIDYVSVTRMRQLFHSLHDSSCYDLPSVLFLNACSSSSRGRYSAGFASGMHEMGLCVLGYHSDIYDDDKPLQAAQGFYQSLCIDQSLQTPHQDPNVITALGAARRRLRDLGEREQPAWGSLRAYIPTNVSFTVHGRGPAERLIQGLYSHFAQWMNPQDYTDHLAVGFQFALFFGAMMGVFNLAFVFPEAVIAQQYTYQEIVSEITRIFLVGPLSFLAAAIFIALQTLRNHQFLRHRSGKTPFSSLCIHTLLSLFYTMLASAAFGFFFLYSFSRLDLLTAQITSFASITTVSITMFWYGFILLLSGMVGLTLILACFIYLRRKETLHSYRTFHVILGLYTGMGVLLVFHTVYGETSKTFRVEEWTVFVILNIVAYGFAVTKILKETSWRALQKSQKNIKLSWRKLIPLLGSVLFVIFCYYFLEESVRFEQQTIQSAMLKRKQEISSGQFDPHTERILERALRQRAISEVPASIMNQADLVKGKDWLLSIICADYVLYRASQQDDERNRKTDIRESWDFLNASPKLYREVQYKDYYRNIKAMLQLMDADLRDDEEYKPTLFEEAMNNALFAVEQDPRNYAYLDTLARAETCLSRYNPDYLEKAALHIRQARWRAFFLRSARAKEVQRAIDAIEKQLDQIRTEFDSHRIPTRNYP